MPVCDRISPETCPTTRSDAPRLIRAGLALFLLLAVAAAAPILAAERPEQKKVFRGAEVSAPVTPFRFDGNARSQRGGLVGGFVLGSVFAIGWTPCIGPVLGSILMMAAVGASPQVVGLLIAYSLGLGIPFILVALAVDRAPLITRPLLRYSRFIEIAGGLLIILLGLALIFDWLDVIARQFAWLDFGTTLEIDI